MDLVQKSLKASDLEILSHDLLNHLCFSNSNDSALLLLLIFHLSVKQPIFFFMFLQEELPARSLNPGSNF